MTLLIAHSLQFAIMHDTTRGEGATRAPPAALCVLHRMPGPSARAIGGWCCDAVECGMREVVTCSAQLESGQYTVLPLLFSLRATRETSVVVAYSAKAMLVERKTRGAAHGGTSGAGECSGCNVTEDVGIMQCRRWYEPRGK